MSVLLSYQTYYLSLVDSYLCPGLRYWGVQVIFPESKRKPGWRYEVVRLASILFSGYYGNGSAENSIAYEGFDLHVHLLFESEREARQFLNSLNERSTEFDIPLKSDARIEEIFTTRKPTGVLLADYKNDSGSPAQKKKIGSVSSYLSGIIPFFNFDAEKVQKMLEKPDLEDIVLVKSLYRMHIAGAAAHPKYSRNPDNFIFASHLLHQLFDGLNLPDSKPTIRISFEKEDDRSHLAIKDMKCVWVKILCKDEMTSRFVISRLKIGSYQDTDAALLHHTYMYVFNVRQFKKFLSFKALEYDNKWGLGVGEDFIETDASDDEEYVSGEEIPEDEMQM